MNAFILPIAATVKSIFEHPVRWAISTLVACVVASLIWPDWFWQRWDSIVPKATHSAKKIEHDTQPLRETVKKFKKDAPSLSLPEPRKHKKKADADSTRAKKKD